MSLGDDSDLGTFDQHESENHVASDRVSEGEDVVGRDIEDEEEEEMAMAMEALLAEDEYRLEPPRPPVNVMINPNHMEDLPQTQTPQRAFRLRGGYEQPLTNEPFVVKFPGRAGSHTVVNNADLDADTDQDHASVDGRDNIFAPFLSEREWEIARWAKLRGPGSTAFTELMSIGGVSHTLWIEEQNIYSLYPFYWVYR